MIVEQDGKRRRKPGFEVWRKRGGDGKLHLMLLVNSRTYPQAPPEHRGWWYIPVEHGGKLACTGPNWRDCYAVSWRKLPEDFRRQALAAILHVEAHGTPMENDESVFD